MLRKTLLEDKETEVHDLTAKLAAAEEKLNASAAKATEADSHKAQLEQLQRKLETREDELQSSKTLAENATNQWQKEKQETLLLQTRLVTSQHEVHSVRAALKERNNSEAGFLLEQMSREVSKLTVGTATAAAAADIDRLEALTYRLKQFGSEEPVEKHTSDLALRLWRLYRSMGVAAAAAARGGDPAAAAVAERVASVADMLHEVHVEQSQTKMKT